MLAYAPPRESARKSPSALTIVIAFHAAGLAALMLAQPGLVEWAPKPPPTEITFVDPLPPPPPDPAPTPPQPRVTPQTPTPPLPTPPVPLVKLPIAGPVIATDQIIDVAPPEREYTEIDLGTGSGSGLVRTEARLKTPPHRLKPDYPASKRRSGEEALLRLRLDVDAAGRVTRVTPLGSFDPVFFEAAERHILRHWRYEPATLGGDAIADDTIVSLQFTLDD